MTTNYLVCNIEVTKKVRKAKDYNRRGRMSTSCPSTRYEIRRVYSGM